MARYIIRLDDPRDGSPYYLEWSTICDAPVSRGMARDELADYIREQYGREGHEALPGRLQRLDAHGTSLLRPTSALDAIEGNRAGHGERELSLVELIDAYCKDEP